MSWRQLRLAAQLPEEAALRYFGLRWTEQRLRNAPGAVVQRSTASLQSQLDRAWWASDPPSRCFDLTPREVLDAPDRYPVHASRIDAAELDWPIRVLRVGDTELVLDGLHRLARAVREGIPRVPSVEVHPSEVSDTCAVIPARLGSTRLPAKALAEVGGLPLVVHTWRRTASSGLFARVVVATDDPGILRAVTRAGGEGILTGPAVSGTERVAFAIEAIGWSGAVLNVQGDQPEVEAEALTAATHGLKRAPIATVAAPLPDDPSSPALVKVQIREGLATRFSRTLFATGLQHHVGLYAFRSPSILKSAVEAPRAGAEVEDLEQVAWMDAGLPIAVEGIASAPEGIDTPSQLAALRARFAGGLGRVPDPPDPSVYAASGLR